MFKQGEVANPLGRPKGVPNRKTAFDNFLFDVFTKNKDKAEVLLNAMFRNGRDFKWLMGLMCDRMPKEAIVKGDMTHTERKIIIEVGANAGQDNAKALPREVL